MKIQNTTFRITPDTIPVIEKEDGLFSFDKKVYTVLVGRNSIPHTLSTDINNLTGIDNLLFEIQDIDGNISQMYLPEDICNGIIRYFQKSSNILGSKNCRGFIIEVLGGKRGDGLDTISDLSSLLPGDIIYMSDGTAEGWNEGRLHYALYIGNGIFISKLGMEGILAFNDLDQLKNIYPKLALIVKLVFK